MEEEIQMLFRLAMPEDWRNRMPSTPPPSSPVLPIKMESEPLVVSSSDSAGASKGFSSLSSSSRSRHRSSSFNSFWSEVGLRSYAQMDFDLELSLGNKKGTGRSSSKKAFASCGRAKKGRKGVHMGSGPKAKDKEGRGGGDAAIGGVEEAEVKPAGVNSAENDQITVKEEAYDGDVEDYEDDICKVVPPNALGLINILRLTLDCPFSDIRKQASNVLFLLKEKGVATPYTLIEGPCTFIHPSECPSIDVDKFASELGFTEVVEGGGDSLDYHQESTEFIDGGVDENVAAQLELKKVGELTFL